MFWPSSQLAIRIISKVVESYKHNKKYEKLLGLARNCAITPEVAQTAGLPQNYKGVVVGSVQRGSTAEKAGLNGVTQNDVSNTQQIGDIIIGIDGHPVRSTDDLITYIDVNKSVGDSVMLSVNRHGQTMNLNLALQARPLLVNQTPQDSVLP